MLFLQHVRPSVDPSAQVYIALAVVRLPPEAMAAAGEGRKRASMRQQKATADIASNNRPTGGMAKADLRNHSFAASGCRISKITNSTALFINQRLGRGKSCTR